MTTLRDVEETKQDLDFFISELQKSRSEISECFIVTFDWDGQPKTYCLGGWHNLPKAAAFLNYEFNRRNYDNEES